MGKLNYTNVCSSDLSYKFLLTPPQRKISGSKLGTTVKKDILKHSVSASKPRSGREPHLEVNLSGKALGDEGLAIACEGFAEALGSGFIKLQELNLAENGITITGLWSLAPVILLAAGDIRDLDLKANKLSITTASDEIIWEEFLHSFQAVSTLRRIDISDNPIGDRGLEVFWRVYAREEPLYLPKPRETSLSESSGDEGFGSDFDGVDGDSDDLDASLYAQARCPTITESTEQLPTSTNTTTPVRGGANGNKSPPKSPHSPRGLTRLHGLRSVPYIVLCRTGATDRSALFLSYVLEVHPTPGRLMYFLPTSKISVHLAQLRENECRGIVYLPNDFSALGKRAIECAEYIRDKSTFRNGGQVDTASTYPRQRRMSEPPPSPIRGRRESFSAASPTPPMGVINATELERSRSKIQGAILRTDGPHSVRLWCTALRMLVAGRALLFDPKAEMCKPYRNRSFRPRASDEKLDTPTKQAQHTPPVNTDFPPLFSPFQSIVEQVEESQEQLSTSEPESDVAVLAGETPVLVTMGVPEERALPANLPEDIWVKIMRLAVDPAGLLSDTQCSNIVQWSKTRETLEKEREVVGKLQSSQVWRVLESVECLSYERN